MLKNLSILFIFLTFANCLGGVIDKGGRIRNIHIQHEATIIRSDTYKVLQTQEVEGESSTFFLLGLIPLSNPLSIDYALSRAAEKVPGTDSLVQIKIWHETHLFFPLGTVSVLKVKGLPVSLKDSQPLFQEPPKKSGGIKIGENDGGIQVGKKKKKAGITIGGSE
jgi:hypothetical protein